jgi:enoyl-CoA hydratase
VKAADWDRSKPLRSSERGQESSHSAKFSAGFVNLGVSGCDVGVSYLLPRLIGASRAFELMLTGRTFDSDEADRVGLLTRRFPTKNS